MEKIGVKMRLLFLQLLLVLHNNLFFRDTFLEFKNGASDFA